MNVAVFPLLDEVLFPGVTLPLHLLEDRYSKMLKEVQDNKWQLAVSLVQKVNDEEFSLNTICGAGSVQIFKEYEDGRSDILVHGENRVRLCSFLQKAPYIVMEAEPIVASESNKKSTRKQNREFDDFVKLIKTWSFLNPEIPDGVLALFDEFKAFGELSDFFAFHFLTKADEKQVYLDCTDPLRRAALLSEFLDKDVARFSKKLAKSKSKFLLH